MSYLVLARKYRPQTFDDVVEQSHVTRTLKNAIAAGRVAHAILFSGPRGTGKTTVARILAKAMCCADGPTPDPCGQCQACREIAGGSAADVFEIDGASNNGVDQVRELRENLKYLPVHTRYKIYIIDEVHMLSTAAFNALLKTLEEPPAHVLFFFATTEPQKIPVTILSRCQRHDLRRISADSVVGHMAALCDQEGVPVDSESLALIARSGDGSMRDALSLLDQIISCADGEVTPQSVIDVLGVVDRSVLFTISSAVGAGDLPTILAAIEAVHDRGQSLKALYAQLVEHFRNLLMVKIGGRVEGIVDVPADERARLADAAAGTSELHLSQVLDALLKAEGAIKFSARPRIALEMACIRICRLQPPLPIETLIERIDRLREAGPAAATTAPPRPAPEPPRPAAPPRAPEARLRPAPPPTEPSRPRIPSRRRHPIRLPAWPNPRRLRWPRRRQKIRMGPGTGSWRPYPSDPPPSGPAFPAARSAPSTTSGYRSRFRATGSIKSESRKTSAGSGMPARPVSGLPSRWSSPTARLKPPPDSGSSRPRRAARKPSITPWSTPL